MEKQIVEYNITDAAIAKKAEIERKEREAFEERIKEAARIQAKKDETKRVAREAEELKEKEEARIAESERQELLKPDKEKLISYASAILNIPLPKIISKEGKKVLEYATKSIALEVNEIIKQSEEL